MENKSKVGPSSDRECLVSLVAASGAFDKRRCAQAMDGAAEAVAWMEDNGVPHLFLTNTTTTTTQGGASPPMRPTDGRMLC